PGHTWKALREHASVARWPLWAIRAHACGVYWAAGLAKCSPAWWSGATLDELHRLGLTSGGLWELARRAVGTQPLAIAACCLELALPALLWIPKTRTLGLVCALALHLGIESSMMVSTFGATMLVLLTSFLPWESTEASTHRPAVPGSAATSLGQRRQPR
ncbi:MAG TPA: HTTM domain-containing protein, partial [Polyangiaceae bacterium]|nr:HTTM domain-containing protein [Polyangiaceae bacterium]